MCAVWAGALLASSPVSAQTFQPRQPRPDWGIFGSGVSNTQQKLILTATFGAGIEDSLLQPVPPADGSQSAPPVYSGPFSSGGASLQYSVDKTSTNGAVMFSAYGRNYKDMSDPFVGTYSLSGDFNFSIGSKGSLRTSSYAGQYLQNLSPMSFEGAGGIPGAPAVPGSPGVFTTGDTYRGFGAASAYTQHLTAKLDASASYAYYANNSWTADPTAGLYDSQFVGAGLRYAVAKGLGLRAGYGAWLGGFNQAGSPLDYRNRTIDAGVDYNKSLSLTRKSQLSFATGVSGVADAANAIHYYFVGHANFSHEIGRTWSIYSHYGRSVDFYHTLGQPTVDDTLSAGVSGLIGRRVEVQSGISGWRGSAVGTGDRVYTSTNVYTTTRVALNRVLGVSANYYYYRYQFADAVSLLPPGFVPKAAGQTFQISLNVFAPLFTEARRPNASR